MGVEELIVFYEKNGSNDELFGTKKDHHIPKDPRLRGIYYVVKDSNPLSTKWNELKQLILKRFEKRLGKGQPIALPT